MKFRANFLQAALLNLARHRFLAPRGRCWSMRRGRAGAAARRPPASSTRPSPRAPASCASAGEWRYPDPGLDAHAAAPRPLPHGARAAHLPAEYCIVPDGPMRGKSWATHGLHGVLFGRRFVTDRFRFLHCYGISDFWKGRPTSQAAQATEVDRRGGAGAGARLRLSRGQPRRSQAARIIASSRACSLSMSNFSSAVSRAAAAEAGGERLVRQHAAQRRGEARRVVLVDQHPVDPRSRSPPGCRRGASRPPRRRRPSPPGSTSAAPRCCRPPPSPSAAGTPAPARCGRARRRGPSARGRRRGRPARARARAPRRRPRISPSPMISSR